MSFDAELETALPEKVECCWNECKGESDKFLVAIVMVWPHPSQVKNIEAAAQLQVGAYFCEKCKCTDAEYLENFFTPKTKMTLNAQFEFEGRRRPDWSTASVHWRPV